MTASWGPGSQIPQLGETMGFSIQESLRTAVSNDAVFKRALNTSCDSPRAWHRGIRQTHPMSSFPLEGTWLYIFSTDIPGLGLWALTETMACHFLPLIHSNNKSKILLYHISSAHPTSRTVWWNQGGASNPQPLPKSEGFGPHMQWPSFSGCHLRAVLMGVLRTPGTTLNKEGSFLTSTWMLPTAVASLRGSAQKEQAKGSLLIFSLKDFWLQPFPAVAWGLASNLAAPRRWGVP